MANYDVTYGGYGFKGIFDADAMFPNQTEVYDLITDDLVDTIDEIISIDRDDEDFEEYMESLLERNGL